MKCIICNTEFHYCSSCGYIAEVEADCCSEECVEKLKDKLLLEEKWSEIARLLYLDNYLFTGDERFTTEPNKDKIQSFLNQYENE